MALVVTALPVPASNGYGAAVDTHLLDAEKSFVLNGTLGASEALVVEVTEDPAGAAGWTGLVAWTNSNPGNVTMNVVAAWMRVKRAGAVGGTAPTASVAATNDGTNAYFAPAVPTPAAGTSGVGAATDVSTGGPNASLSFEGDLNPDEALVLEGSNDLASWNSLMAFTHKTVPGFVAMVFNYLRVRRVNSSGRALSFYVGTARGAAGGGGAFPGFGGAPPAVATASAPGATGLASDAGHTHAFDFPAYLPSLVGMQAGGVVQQTYVAPTATPAVLTLLPGVVPFAHASNGTLTQQATVTSNGLIWNAASARLEITRNAAGTATALLLRNQNAAAVGVTLGFEILGTTIVGQIQASSSVFNIIANGGAPMALLGGGAPFLYALTAAKDIAVGEMAAAGLTTVSTSGWLWHPRSAGAPTGVPVNIANPNLTQSVPAQFDSTNVRWYAYINAGWHFAQLMDYDPTPTRVPFGGATAHTLTDSANMTFVTNTLFLNSPVAGVGSPLVLDNNDAGATVTRLNMRMGGANRAKFEVQLTGGIYVMNVGPITAGAAQVQRIFLTGGSTSLCAFVNDGDLGLGNTTVGLLTTTTVGFPYLFALNGAPTGVPTNAATAQLTNSGRPVVLDYADQTGRFYAYIGAAWHYAALTDYTPTATRVPVGAATAGTQTDTADFTYVVASGQLTLGQTGGVGNGGAIKVNAGVNGFNPGAGPKLAIWINDPFGAGEANIGVNDNVMCPQIVGWENGVQTALNVAVGGGGNDFTVTYNANIDGSGGTVGFTMNSVTGDVSSNVNWTVTAPATVTLSANTGAQVVLNGDFAVKYNAGASTAIQVANAGGGINLATDVGFTTAPNFGVTEANGAQVLTLTNGPTATGGGNPDRFLTFKNGGNTCVVPAWDI